MYTSLLKKVKGMETSPLSAYRCYYCALNGCFETVINHSFDIHTEEPLKCRQLVLDSSTGKFKYQTKQYDVLPSKLKQSRKYIACDSLNESIHIQASSDDCSPFRKRQKNDCTSRIRQNLFGSTLETELDIHTRNAEHSEEDTTNNSMDLSLASIEEMSKLLPAVVHELSKVDKIDGLLSFMRLVKSGKFPLENIAFELFLDVVKWFSVENSSLMRYNKNTKDFWRLGYRLFHGRFIRFMSGFKHIGSIVAGRTERGNFNPQSSQVNFAVPDVSIIRSLSRAENVESIRPGILSTMLDKISINSAANTYKICFDGKKINSSVAEGGEIDLWGFETSPTLRDMKDKLERETLLVIKTKEALQELVQYNESITSLPLPLKCTVLNQLKSIIKVLSVNLKSLREKRLCAENGLSKFKKLGGTDWKTSKYLYVISYLTSRLYEIGECVNSLSKTIDSLGYICSVMNSCGHLYARATEVNLGQQENFVCLSDVAYESEEVQPCYIKQRCERWLEIRKTARATGSTLHAALGLNSLKTQLQHFDYVVNGLEKPSVDNQAKQRMQYGTDHEIDAVATLVSKVLPIFCPDVTYVEEGCYIEYNDNHTLLIVSPDGSGHKDIMGKTVLAFEFKCPFPGKVFTTPVHYSLPPYYILQVLSEMVVLRTDTMLYLCYSEETSTVLEVTFSEHLWSLVWQELVSVYGTKKPTRPMRKSSKLIEIRAEMEIFLKENVSLIAEVPSVRAKPCYHAAHATPNFPYHFTHITNQQRVNVQPAMHNLIESLVSAEKGIQETYRLTKTRATEVLVFMMSDLDRIYKPEIPHSVPIAYGLQGRSLTTSVMRKMLRHVLSECAKRGLYVPVFSSDGQWYNLCVKDNADQPLTILQLQKSVWADVKKRKKTQILNELSEINIVHSDSAKFTETVDIQIENETLCIGRSPGNRVPILTSDHVKLLSINKSQDESNILECSATDDVDEIMSMIPSSIEDKMGNDFIEHLRNFVKSSMHTENTESDVNIDTAEVIENADEIPFSQIQDITNEFRSQLDQSGSQHISPSQSVITNDHVKQMLNDLQINAPLKWNSVTEQELLHKMSSAKLINQYFLRSDLIVCLKVVQAILKRNSIKCRVSWSKEQIVNLFSQQLGDKSVLQSSVRQIRRSPVKLKHLCRKSISKYPKHLLNILLSEHRFPECLEKWNENKPFQRTVKLASSNIPESWYSQPEYNLDTETYLFGVLDGHHLLTNARAKCCSSGMPKAKIKKSAWLKVASDSKNNGTKLNLSMVEDLIDKQSNAFAQRTFSEEVEQQMRLNGDFEEAEFCRLIRNWYLAEDEPGIPALDRCFSRLELRDWLLSKYNCFKFPPPGTHVCDIPVVLFEGLVTNCERKIQMYGFVKSGCYNARTISSLDSENFFSDFQELDPKGTGTIRPEDIPRAIGTAVEIIHARINPERHFTIRTSNAPVYPSMERTNSPTEIVQVVPEEGDVESDPANSQQIIGHERMVDNEVALLVEPAKGPSFDANSELVVSDHIFDTVSRKRRRPKRKQGDITYPDLAARGIKGVRQHHKADESKILPTVRLGIPLE